MNRKNGHKLVHLEGLRGVAALMVVLCHVLSASFYYHREAFGNSVGSWGGTTVGDLAEALLTSLLDGTLAVYIFWVLSGYVVTIKLFRSSSEKERKLLFLRSVSKRYFRLMIPVLASVLLGWGLLASGAMHSQELSEYPGMFRGEQWLGRHYGFEADLGDALKNGLWDAFFAHDTLTSYNSSLWTMQPELIGSILCFCLAFVARKGMAKFFLIISGILTSLVFHEYWLTCFLSGLLLSAWDHSNEDSKLLESIHEKWERYVDRGLISRLGLVILLAILVLSGWYREMQGLKTCAAIGITYIAHRSSLLSKLLSTRPMEWLGKTSFGLYLVHIPIICSLGCWFWLQYGPNEMWVIWTGSLLSVAVSLIAGAVFYRIADRPSVKISNWIGIRFSRLARSYREDPEKERVETDELEHKS